MSLDLISLDVIQTGGLLKILIILITLQEEVLLGAQQSLRLACVQVECHLNLCPVSRLFPESFLTNYIHLKVSIGADGGGSIRLPASFCGVYGLKPTTGRMSSSGSFPLATSVGVVGPIAASAVDLCIAVSAFLLRSPTFFM